MAARIVFALLLLFHGLPLGGLTPAATCAHADSAHCPYHGKAREGDHCTRASAASHHHAASPQDGAVHAARCSCQRSAAKSLTAPERFVESAPPRWQPSDCEDDAAVLAFAAPEPLQSAPPSPPPRTPSA